MTNEQMRDIGEAVDDIVKTHFKSNGKPFINQLNDYRQWMTKYFYAQITDDNILFMDFQKGSGRDGVIIRD